MESTNSLSVTGMISMALTNPNESLFGINSSTKTSISEVTKYSFTNEKILELPPEPSKSEFLSKISPATLNSETNFKPFAATAKYDSFASRFPNVKG
uniref:Putative ovule protein n=1 Tax=Solanum chacoense TaxID=4108 RepID=A0A0V0HAC7_SOLCH